jgi:hypothetical protein
MAVTIIHKAEDVSAQSEGKITTLERVMIVNGDNMAEIASSNIIPKNDSRHPLNSSFVLTNRQFERVGNVGRKVQAQVTLTYSNAGEVAEDNKDPWDLDAQNVQISYNTEPTPLLEGYKKNGEKIQLLNSAGSRLLIEGQSIIRQISFMFCVKAKKSGEAPINNRAIINSSAETVAGYSFAAFTAMLMPMNASFVQDVNDDGEIYRRYWQIEAVILENEKTWQRKALNVGTMAKFSTTKPAQPIYQYTPWTSDSDAENMLVKPKFGSIDDVIAAKNAYANNFPDSEKQSRFDMLPYQEITEPLPLTVDGKVYEQALVDPKNNPYLVVPYFETKPANWSQWNLPKKRA